MRALTALLVCSSTVFAGLSSVDAQEKPRLPRIGYLALGSITAPAFFAQKMREQGYVEGQTATFEYRFAEGRHGRLLPLARELSERQVDVLYAYGDEAIAAAQIATRTIPIVMFACDAVTTGFVASLARPGGNTTGVTCITTELSGKRVAVFHEMIPRLTRLAVLYNPENKSKPMDFAQTREAANSLGMSVDGFEAREPADIERIFAGFAANKPDGVSVLDEAFTMLNAKRIVELARIQSLPSMHSFREPVDAGGLLSYGPSQAEMTAIATTFIGKILKGAKPADLPVQQPTRFELVINLRTAKALRLTIPPALLARADAVIE
jgi:putative tryptophan/tyrosine transport system substrate-binding protein